MSEQTAVPQEVTNWIMQESAETTMVDSTGQKWERYDRPVTDDDPLTGRGKLLFEAAQSASDAGENQGVVFFRTSVKRIND